MKALAAAAHGLARAANLVAVACLALIVLVLFWEIGARFVFNRPTGWSDVAAAYLMPALVFLGAGQTLLRNGHVRIDSLLNLMGTRTRRLVDLFNETVGLAVLAFASWYCVVMVMRVHRSEGTAFAGTYIFMEWPPRLVVPIGVGIMALAQLVIWLLAVIAVVAPERRAATAALLDLPEEEGASLS